MAEEQKLVLAVNGWRFDAIAAGPERGELVLLLHGFPQFADAWTPVMARLGGAGYRTVAVDQRGYSPGARPTQVEEYGLERLVSDTLGFADVLGATRFHLVGHDWGGLIAWQVAAEHPERLRTVTVLATPHTSAFSETVRSDLDQMNRSKYILLFKAPGHVAEAMLLAFHAKALRSAYQGKVAAEQVESNVSRLSEEGALTAALNWYRALPPTARADKVRVPALYVWGEKDTALGQTAALKTAEYVVGPYRFERIAGGSHWLVEEDAERMSGLILEHLAQHAEVEET